nr:hypothetical protein Ade03nite_20880 [Actinoplanes derwentensis]
MRDTIGIDGLRWTGSYRKRGEQAESTRGNNAGELFHRGSFRFLLVEPFERENTISATPVVAPAYIVGCLNDCR